MLIAAMATMFARGTVIHAGAGYMFRMTPPAGWILAVPVAGTVADYAWKDARLTLSALPKGKKKAEAVIDETLVEAMKTLPGSVSAAAGSFRTQYNDTGFLFAVGPKEAEGKRLLLAFYNAPQHVVAVGLASPSREAQTAVLDKFASYVRSFGFVTDKVRVKG